MPMHLLENTQAAKGTRLAAPAMALSFAVLLVGCNLEFGGGNSAGAEASVTLTWAPAVERVNGELLTDDDISGYVIRYRASASDSFYTVSIDNCHSNRCSHTIDRLSDSSQYEFQVAAVDSDGLYSAFTAPED